MHPDHIEYRGKIHDLKHLGQRISRFSWTPKGEAQATFSVRVRFGNHCYSREIKPPATMAEDDVFVANNPLRVFCDDRHSYTPDLVTIIDGLFLKPTTSVALTSANRNWHVFKLYSRPVPESADRYCIFFNVKREMDELDDGSRPLDLFVESAYVRDKLVPTIKKVPFGTVADLTWKRQKYF